MANEEMYEPDIISVNDEDGNEILFELLDVDHLILKALTMS